MNADHVQSYVTAFYEAAVERWTSTLDGVASALAKNPQLRDRLSAADADFAGRQRLLDAVIPPDADLPVRNLLYTLTQHGDLDSLSDIAAALRERARQTEVAPVQVDVVSAIALTDDQRRVLVEKLEAQYGAGLVFSYRVEPSILGGLVVRVGDKLIDGSVASRLAAMKQALGVTSNE
jgi:F-type H+-transporting ATPase subunit delta